jgi:hypothetical protein
MAGYREAVDEILTRFGTEWAASAAAAISAATAPQIVYEDDEDGSPDREGPFVRITVQHADGSQRTLGETGNRQFEHEGIAFVQVFAPIRASGSMDVAQRLAEVAVAAFEGKRTASVWFRNVRINEIGRSGPFFQINVAADFQWSQVN